MWDFVPHFVPHHVSRPFFFTYDLVGANASQEIYEALVALIREYVEPVHVQDSVWLVKTSSA
jgi:hypothetical protein